MFSDNKEKKSIRSAYGKTLAKLGETNKDIFALDADLSCSTQTQVFAKAFPDRFFNMGISEQDMMTTAAGLAASGKIVFASTFAIFASGRAWEQIRNSIAYPEQNVKIVATHGGITVGEDGVSHQALEDISIMRSIPNMMVVVPCDYNETAKVIEYAAKHKGPMYIRLARTSVVDVFDEKYDFNPNKAVKLKDGNDMAIFTNGETLAEVLDAVDILNANGISAKVVHVPVVKPIDINTILETTKGVDFVVTVENHSIIGGLGSAVCEVLSENQPKKVFRIGLNDEFGQSGEQRALMEYYGLTGEKIADKIIKRYKKEK